MQTLTDFTFWNRFIVHQMQILHSEEEVGIQPGIKTYVANKIHTNSG